MYPSATLEGDLKLGLWLWVSCQISTISESVVEGEVSKIMDLAFENDVIFYFNADAERLVIF